MKKFLITTMLGIATTAAFGAASVRAPQMGGTTTVTTPTATNTARAGTMRTQTMKTSSVSTPTSVTTTQSIATPVSTETTDARIALLKGIKGFNPGKIKDTTAAQQQDLTEINSRIEDLRAQLDQAEAAQSSIITESNIDAKIDEKFATSGLVTRDQLQQIMAAMPNYRSDLQKVYNTTLNGQRYYCEIWQISIPEWSAIESTFIIPKCDDHEVIYSRTCILDGEAKKLQNTDYKWRFNLCYRDNNTASVAEHFNTIGIDNPLQATEGFTILTNASDARIDDVYIPAFCGHETNYWCGKYSIDGEYNYDNPQDRTLKMYRRLEGIYMTNQTFEQSGTNTWIVQRYATNEPGENSTKAEVAAYVRENVCENMAANDCIVPEASVFIHPTTLWAKPRYEIEVHIQIPSPTFIEQISTYAPFQVTQGITVSTNASDEEIDNSVIPFLCGHEPNYWCSKYGDIEGELDPTNPRQGRTLKIQKRLEGFYTNQQYFVNQDNNVWDCKTYWTNDPGENNDSAQAATYVRTQVCRGKEPDKCFVTNSVINPTQWAKPRYQVDICSLVDNELPTPLTY